MTSLRSNTELIPNYADVQEGMKDQEYNTLDGVRTVFRTAAGPNYLMFGNDDRPRGHRQLERRSGRTRLAEYSGKISIYDDSIFIADAAVYLKATQPDLNIDNPYSSTRSSSTPPSTC